MLTLEEQDPSSWEHKLTTLPAGVSHTRHLSILNQCRIPGGFFYDDTVPARRTGRIHRWYNLDDKADIGSVHLVHSAVLKGTDTDWDNKLSDHQLHSFR